MSYNESNSIIYILYIYYLDMHLIVLLTDRLTGVDCSVKSKALIWLKIVQLLLKQ